MNDLINLDYCILHLDYNFNIEKLLEEYENVTMQNFSKLNPRWIRSELIGSYGNSLVKEFSKYAKGRVAAGYYHQYASDEIKEHRDTGCKCRINILLKDNDSILYMAGHELKYKAALLNVNEYKHSVGKSTTDRLIFSLVFVEDSYSIVKEKIQNSN